MAEVGLGGADVTPRDVGVLAVDVLRDASLGLRLIRKDQCLQLSLSGEMGELPQDLRLGDDVDFKVPGGRSVGPVLLVQLGECLILEAMPSKFELVIWLNEMLSLR